jgi:hypothetical protein
MGKVTQDLKHLKPATLLLSVIIQVLPKDCQTNAQFQNLSQYDIYSHWSECKEKICCGLLYHFTKPKSLIHISQILRGQKKNCIFKVLT